MNPQMQNQAMSAAVAPEGAAPQAPSPSIPPELIAVAESLGLDITNPEHLMILLQMLGAGGGGPMGPMAGAPPAGPPPMGPPPQGPPQF